jgi:hypothetical protein
LSGNPLDEATGTEELTIDRSEPVVVEAVSKLAALVRMNEVTLSFIPPLSLRLVWAYPVDKPPHRPAPNPVPLTTVLRPVLIW